MLEVGGRLLGQGLEEGALHAHEFLGGLHGHDGLGEAEGLAEGGFGRGHVEFDQLFHTGVGLLGGAFEGVHVGFVGGDDLFSGVVHFGFLEVEG